VPKIRAATLAEHRRMQRAALLEAARGLLVEGGMEALTFPALAERTGLARSSVYEYFRSRAAVVEELCAADFPAWAAGIEAAVSAAGTPLERVAAYVRAQLALAGDPRHRAVVAISAGELDQAARERIRASHGQLVGLVTAALAELGHREPALVAALLQGIVAAAVKRLELGAAESPEAIIDAAVGLASRGAAAPARLSAPPR
jgi:AcrR family transcriptional regulator